MKCLVWAPNSRTVSESEDQNHLAQWKQAPDMHQIPDLEPEFQWAPTRVFPAYIIVPDALDSSHNQWFPPTPCLLRSHAVLTYIQMQSHARWPESYAHNCLHILLPIVRQVSYENAKSNTLLNKSSILR